MQHCIQTPVFLTVISKPDTMKNLFSLAVALLLLTSAVTAQESYSETRNVTGFNEVSFAVPGKFLYHSVRATR